jgi:putative ABC transport system substrate-binding protein
VQFAILAARERIPAAYTQRGYVAAGGLMSYGSDQVEMIRQAGAHSGSILRGARAFPVGIESEGFPTAVA